MRITFIGGGNMARALIGGLVVQGYAAAEIQVVEPHAESRERLMAAFALRCVATLDTTALDCDTLVLAVKPQQMREALQPLRGKLTRQLVVSIAAGLRLNDISRWLGGYRQLVRTMPNMAAFIGRSITGLYADPSVQQSAHLDAERVMRAVGATMWLKDEVQMDAVTAISGSGPAYVFYFIEAMEAAAIQLGFDAKAARKLTIDTFLGAADLANQSAESITTLRLQVTSKGGTTEAALNSFASNKVADAIGSGIAAAAARGRQLGDLLSQD